MIVEAWICVIRVSVSAAGISLLPPLCHHQTTIDQCYEGRSYWIIMIIMIICDHIGSSRSLLSAMIIIINQLATDHLDHP